MGSEFNATDIGLVLAIGILFIGFSFLLSLVDWIGRKIGERFGRNDGFWSL